MKMSLETLERVIASSTAKEIDFLVYIMRFQDNMGIVRGITRAEVCSAIGIHKSKFYATILSLETKGIIRVFWSEKRHGFWTMSVIGNSFAGKEDYKKGYINLNTNFLWSAEFLTLTRAEKIICLKILAIYRENKHKIALSFKTLTAWTGSSLQSVTKHIASIKTLFDVTVDKGIITVNIDSCAHMFARNLDSESHTHNKHLVDYILAVKNASSPLPDEMADTLSVFKVWGGKHGTNAVVTAILRCLDNYGKLIPKYINRLTQIVGRNKSLIELFY